MPNSTGTHSYGTALGLDTSGGSSYVSVAEVKKIDRSSLKVTTSSMFNLLSPSAHEEKRPGKADAGQLSLTLNFTKAQYATFLTNVRKALMSWKITYPLVGSEVTASNETFAGHIGELGVAVPEDDTITVDVTVEISGVITFTQGS